MDYIYDITLHLIPSGEIPVVTVKQGDTSTRFIKVTVIKEDSIYHPGAEQTVLFREEKPDGTGVLADNKSIDTELERYLVTVDADGFITIELTEQMTVCPGYCKCDLCFVSDGETISTAPFILEVVEVPDVTGLATSSNDFRSLVNALDKVWDAGVAALPGVVDAGTLVLGPDWEGDGPYTYKITQNMLPSFATFPTYGGRRTVALAWNDEQNSAAITGYTEWSSTLIGLYDDVGSMGVPSVLEYGTEYEIRYSTTNENIKLVVQHNSDEIRTTENLSITFAENDTFQMFLEISGAAEIDDTIQISMYTKSGWYTPTEKTVVNIMNDPDVIRQMVADGVTSIYIVNRGGDLTAYAIDGRPSVQLTVPVVYMETGGGDYDNVQDGQIIAYDEATGSWVNKDLSDYGLLDENGVRALITSYGYQTADQVNQLIRNYITTLDANSIRY